MKFNRIALAATLLTTLWVGSSYKAWADDDYESYGQPETHDFVRSRTYIGFYGTSTNVNNNNDFSGYNVYGFGPVTVGGNQVEEEDFVPAIDRNFGWGAMAGHREGPWAAEVSYWYTNHTGTISGFDSSGNPTTLLTTTAVLSSINIDMKRYFLTGVPTQPFVQLGVNWSFLSSHNTSELLNISTSPATLTAVGDQTESGFGLNLGVGLEIYLGDGLSLVGGAVQRFTAWSTISGVGKSDLSPSSLTTSNGSLEGDGINFYVGGTLGLGD